MTNTCPPPVHAYTDGACSGNPGPGGWGALLITGNQKKEICGGTPDTTNNRMEMTAVIEALRALPKGTPVTIFTDSTYVMKGMTEWMDGWKKRGWKNSQKKPVLNKDLWLTLDALASEHTLTWQWVKGHSGNPGNERADALANEGLEKTRNTSKG